ncbi:Hypothetical protein, putative [Bodo saltans]|uniref:Uncharacterized protein n=1 Tax=Bodo saltans TaxID=75058 RepID=A0A0S4JFK1_BODSA|nr:Hypothetical protein, putative [Bodo saltans]|eukprot:CUG90280.1 Hypothetical protein, putative [Bodo saltans]
MENDELVHCPNCQCLTAQSDLRPISIGAIYRHAKAVEKAQHTLVKAGQATSHDGQTIPLQSLFSDLNVNWVPMPPILEHLHYSIEEIGRHSMLQQKDTHICQQCFDVYADEIEIQQRAARLQSSKNKDRSLLSSASPRRYQQSVTSTVLEPVVFERINDRKKDFAFTTLQTSIRTRERAIDEKRRARRKLVELQISDVDWEGLPATAGKEIRRIQEEMTMDLAVIQDAEIAATTTSTGGALVPISPQQRRGGSAKSTRNLSPTRRLGSAHSHRGGVGAPLLPVVGEPLSKDELDQIHALTGAVVPVSQDPRTSFDVPLQHRFMHELWMRMCSELDFGAQDAFLHLTDAKGEHVLQHQKTGKDAAAAAAGGTATPAPAHSITVSVPSPDDSKSAMFVSRNDSLFANSVNKRNAKYGPETVPIRHPFFPILQRNQLRLPTPPVPLMVQKPNEVSTAANVEDAIQRIDHLLLKNSKAIRRAGMQDAYLLRELSQEEQDMLAIVVGDPTIEVPSDDDDDDIAQFDSEDGDDDYIEEDEEDPGDVFDDY